MKQRFSSVVFLAITFWASAFTSDFAISVKKPLKMAAVRRSSRSQERDHHDVSGVVAQATKPLSGLPLFVQGYSEVQCLMALLAFNASILLGLIVSRSLPGPPLGIFREVLAGGLAAALTEIFFYPADVVKVRVQIAKNSPENRANHVSLLGTAKRILREEGAAGLFANGVVAGNCRALIYQGLRLGLFPSLKQSLMLILPGSGGFGPRAISGMATGALGALLTSPLDLAKVRMMAQRANKHNQSSRRGTEKNAKPTESNESPRGSFSNVQTSLTGNNTTGYANSFDALFTIAREEGVVGGPTGGLWRASGASVLRAAMASGAQLAAYDGAKSFALAAGFAGSHPAAAAALASQFGAVAYTTAAAPIDLVKSRLMAEKAAAAPTVRIGVGAKEKSTRQPTALSMLVDIVRADGLWTLWRGWVPATLSLMPVVAIVFPLMELLRSLMGVGSF